MPEPPASRASPSQITPTHVAAPHVATLLCDPGFPALADRHLVRAREALETAQEPVWLDKGIAADIAFAPTGAVDCRALAEKLRHAIADAQIDVIVQPVEGRRKNLLFIEMDKVLLGQNTLEEIAAIIGCKPQLAEINGKVEKGEIDFAGGLRAAFLFLQGRGTECLSHVLGKTMVMTPGARVLIETMRANGATAALATLGFSCFAGPVADRSGITEIVANRLVLENNKIAALAEPVLDPAGKRADLERRMAAQALPASAVLAVAHDLTDLPLLKDAGMGVAFRAERTLATAAAARIDCGDLSALLYLQGYRREDFATEARRPLDASNWKRKYGAYEKAHERSRR